MARSCASCGPTSWPPPAPHALAVTRPVAAQPMTATTASAQMEVSAPPTAEPGLLDGLVGAVLGFLFG